MAGSSDPYAYLAGGGEGENEFDDVEFALALSTQPADDLSIFAQVSFASSDDGEETEVELAIAERAFSDQARLRFGRSKMPFGIYTEIYDIGTLRPFLTLPQSIYGPTGFVSESYDGIGISGHKGTDGGWGLDWNV